MEPTKPFTPRSGAARPEPTRGSVAEAAASLAPVHTHFAHRPDWQAASDDEADAARDASRGS